MLAFLLILWPTAPAFQVGEEVLVRHEGFYLGAEVVSLSGGEAKVKLLYDEPETVQVPLDDLASMDSVGEKPAGFRGPWILFRSHGNFWFRGRIQSSDAHGLTVVDPDGGEPMKLRYNDVYFPPAHWLFDLAKEAERSEELAAIKINGLPLGAGDPVEVGDYVIAEQFEGSWYEARVTAIRRGKYDVAFPGGEKAQVSVSRAAPIPGSDETFDVELGDVVFARLDELSAWVAARVDRIEGANLHVTFGSGETIYVTPGKYLPQAP